MILWSIQYLRAIAALMVVVFHFLPQLERMGYAGYWPDWLAGGVDIFFVISGFIMWMTTAGRNTTPGDFYMRRIIRILPLYWLLTTVVVGVMMVAPHLLQTTKYDLWHIVSSYLFIPAVRPGTSDINPVLHPGWTLNHEMFFYLLFGLLLWAPERIRIALMGVALGGLVAVGYWLRTSTGEMGPFLAFHANSIVLEFLLGMLLAHAYRQGMVRYQLLLGWAGVLIGFVGIALLPTFFAHAPRVIILGLPALAIVAGALALSGPGSQPRHAWLMLLGNASYSIYLSHSMVLSAAGQVWRRFVGLSSGGGVLFCLFGLVASIAVGLAVYRLLEQPLTDWLRKGWEQRKQTGRVGRIPVSSN